MMIKTIRLLVPITFLYFVYGLECGFGQGSGNVEIKKLADSCVNVTGNDSGQSDNGNNSSNSTNNGTSISRSGNSTTSNDSTNNNSTSTTGTTDNGTSINGNTTNSASTNSTSTNSPTTNGTITNGNNVSQKNSTVPSNGPRRSRRSNDNNNMEVSTDQRQSVQTGEVSSADTQSPNNTQQCIVQCIFEKLEMNDVNGYPDYAKVSEGLLSKANGRPLRDFLQDSADICFQQLKDYKGDPCQFSIKLIGCLAEKAKLNCADWPVGELPFQMNVDNQPESHYENGTSQNQLTR